MLTGEDSLADAIRQGLAAAGATVRTIKAAELRHAGAAAQLSGAAALVLAGDDDPGNVDVALAVRREHPALPLVVRLFDGALGAYLEETLPGTVVLSMSAMAAPVFAEAAKRAAATHTGGTRRTGGASSPAKGPARAVRTPGARRAWLARRWPDRVLLSALIGLVALVASATAFFARVLGLRTIDALYFVLTTVTTVGYGDIALKDAPPIAKAVGVAVMVSGSCLVAVLLAVLTGWVVSRRLDVWRGHFRARGRGHVVIAGCGNVGFRVAALLQAQGQRVVVIERNDESRHIAALRHAGHHVIVADAASDRALDLARVDDASVMLALTDAQATNLQIALKVRARGAGTPVVIKAASPELSAHVSERRDAVAISPIAVAAEAFVEVALRVAEPRV